jgi:hypothetical protein
MLARARCRRDFTAVDSMSSIRAISARGIGSYRAWIRTSRCNSGNCNTAPVTISGISISLRKASVSGDRACAPGPAFLAVAIRSRFSDWRTRGAEQRQEALLHDVFGVRHRSRQPVSEAEKRRVMLFK